MRRRRCFVPSVSHLESRAMLDGDLELAMGPPPEVQPGPPGGVLDGPDLTSSGNGAGYHPGSPDGGDFQPPPPEGDPNLVGMYPDADAEAAGSEAGALIGGVATTGAGGEAVGPAPVEPTDAFA
jgi:hypothetical protein